MTNPNYQYSHRGVCVNLFRILILAGIMLVGGTGMMTARTVSGIVLAESDSSKVIGALCEIKVADKQIASTTTNEEGGFSLDFSNDDAVDLFVSLAGFKRSEIIIPAGKKDMNVGEVYLSDAVALKEVTVEAHTMVSANGRTIVYPSATQIKASSTALSLFQKLPLPGLIVNPIQRSMSVEGSTPVIVINGIPSNMEDVNSLQAKDIERVEYSAIVPARYAAAGGRGFISITLKKREDGGTFYGWVQSAFTTGFMDGSINTSYHQGPSQFSLRYTPTWRNYQDVEDYITESFIADDFRVDIDHQARSPFHYFFNPINMKYIYTPNERTVFQASFNTRISEDKHRMIGIDKDTYFGDYSTYRKTSANSVNSSLDLYLRHDFDKKNSLEVEVVGTLSTPDFRYFTAYTYADGSSDDYTSNVDGHRRSLISEIHYKHDFSENSIISVGGRNTLSYNRNKYLITGYSPILTDNNTYVYANYQHQVKRVYLNLTTGMQMIWMKNDFNKRHFIRNVTRFNTHWTITDHWNSGAEFAFSPQIPGLAALTDYPQQVSPYMINNGNPDLKVAKSYNYSVYANFNKNKFSAQIRVGQNLGRDYFTNVLSYLGDRTFLSHAVNYRSQKSTSASLYLSLSDFYGFGGAVYTSYDYYESKGEGWHHTLGSLSCSFGVWWNKGPFTIGYGRTFPSKNLYAQMVSKGENNSNLSVSYKPNKHWVIDASVFYVFTKHGCEYPQWSYEASHPSYTQRYIKDDGNMFVLSVSYTADFGSIFRTAKRTLNNSDNGSAIRTF